MAETAIALHPLADDLLEGAEAIAKFLGKKWNANRVRLAKHRKQLPVRSRPGMGIYAFKSELDAFLRAPESLVTRTPESLTDESA